MWRASFLLLSLWAVSHSVLAHNVVSGVYADGMLIEGEIGFSNGDMAEAGVEVGVFDKSGESLGTTTLQEGGMFSFTARSAQTHIFRANLSSGHVAEMMLEADELSAGEGVGSLQAASLPESTPAQAGLSVASKSDSSGAINTLSAEALQSMIRSAVSQQVRPLQKELRAYKEKVMFRDITGGLGFIFGLFGVAAWMASKRNKEEG